MQETCRLLAYRADAQAALAFLNSPACDAQIAANGGGGVNACLANPVALFTAVALLRNADATGGLAAYTGTQTQFEDMERLVREPGRAIIGEPDDPLYMFNVNRPLNQQKANIDGFELGSQYFFGDSGFGIQSNPQVNGDVGSTMVRRLAADLRADGLTHGQLRFLTRFAGPLD